MKFLLSATLVVAGMGLQAVPANADLGNSIYVPLDNPCRVGDTRKTSGPVIPPGTQIDWLAYGSDFSGQGGAAAGCAHPKDGAGINPTGIAVNITADGALATGKGNLVAFATDGVAPIEGSLVNYTLGAISFNSTIVGLCNDGVCDGKFSIQSNNSGVPAIADVQGYFYAQPGGVAHVARSGGDYSSPVDAIGDLATWCGTPSATNRCLVDIAPGSYDLGTAQLVIPENVSVRGAGQLMTSLLSRVDTGDQTSATITMALNSEVSDLGVANQGGGTISIGLAVLGGSPSIKRVSAAGLGGTQTNVGVLLSVGTPTLIDVSATGVGGSQAIGVNHLNGGGTLSNVKARGVASVLAIGARVRGPVLIRESFLVGTTHGLDVGSGAGGGSVVNSKIEGGVLDGDKSTTNCRGNYDPTLKKVKC